METDPSMVFGKVLKALRERAKLSQNQVAAMVYCSGSLISGIEQGTKRAKLDLVKRLDGALGAGGVLLLIWPVTHLRGWPVNADGKYAPWFDFIADLEAKATKIHEWEMRYVPGFLQTADYARAVMCSGRPRQLRFGDDEESIERDVTARLDRQGILTRDNLPRAWFIIEESVLHRVIGSPAIMGKQLEHLESMAELNNVIIQIMPLDAVGHSGGEGPMRVLEFADSPPVVYTEGRWSGRVIESGDELAVAMSHLDLIRASALPPSESIAHIAEVRSRKYG